MTKLVFVNRFYAPDKSATSQLLSDLATELAEAHYDVHVICSRQRYDDPTAVLPERETVGGVRVRRVWTTRFGRGNLIGRALDYASFYLSSGLAMLLVLRRGDTLIVKTDPPLISIVAMVAAACRRATLVNWLQDIFPEVASLLDANPLPHPLNRLLRYLRDASLRAAHVNVVLGTRMHAKLVAFGIPAAQICIIPNWAERRPALPRPAAFAELRKKLALTTEFVVAYSGNLGRAHECQTILEAAARLDGQANAVFLMVGGGTGMTQLAQMVDARGLHNFRFLPYLARADLADGLAAADVHWVSLRPSLEGYIVPSKFYGILAAARPVLFIGAQDGELATAIQNHRCGATVEIGDVEAVVALLQGWGADPILREELGRLARFAYDEHYSAARAFECWRRLLKQVNRVAGVEVQPL